MKTSKYLIVFTLTFIIGMNYNNIIAQDKINSDTIKGTSDWKKIIITKNAKDIEGMTEIGDVEGKASKVFGSVSSLKKKARENVKKNAAKLGATYILIEDEDFSNSPINNVSILAIAYKQNEEE